MSNDINKLLARLREQLLKLDEADFEFDYEAKSQSINTEQRSTGEKEGSEKFAARRKVKKLNRLMKEAEKEGYSIADLFDSGTPAVSIDKENESVVVDHPDAELDWEPGENVVIVEAGDKPQTKELPFSVESVERECKGGMSIFQFNDQ